MRVFGSLLDLIHGDGVVKCYAMTMAGTPIGMIVTENMQQLFRNAAFPPTQEKNQEFAYQGILQTLKVLNESKGNNHIRHGRRWVLETSPDGNMGQGVALEEEKLTVRARFPQA